MLKYLILLSWIFYTSPVLSWSANGHRVVGQITYDYLIPKAKRRFAHINQSLNKNHRYYSLISATVWMDTLYDQQLLSLKPMHYIDIPFSVDNTPLPKISSRNAVSAIHQASLTVIDPEATMVDQAIALRILLHVVGDVHQPLHAVTRVSVDHPKGDRGGNDFRLGKNKIALNLHRYWDQGGGLLSLKLSAADIRALARSIEEESPCPAENLNAMDWAEESHQLAVHQAYKTEEYAVPSADYEQDTRTICKQRLAYAGCRLAALLNHL